MTLAPFTSGKLYVNDEYFCEFVVNKVPDIKTEKNGKITFTMQILCPVPYWNGVDPKRYSIGHTVTKEFSFPLSFNTHRFGTTVRAAFTNVENPGDVNSSFVCTFYSNADVQNYGIINSLTSQKLLFNDVLHVGEKVTCYRENGRIKAMKEDADGNQEPIIGLITDDSYVYAM